MNSMRERVAIVGAGVSGLTCGVVFAESGYRTSIFAEESGPRITSAAAGAIWFPYDAEPANAVIAWSLETFDILRELSDMPGSGVSMLELRSFARTGELEIPPWASSLGARRLAPALLPVCFTSGYTLLVPLTDTTIYLDYLAARFRRAGGEIQVGVHLVRLDEVNRDCSLLINCTGVGARTLVPDPEVEPHRGQVAIVPRIPQTHAVVCDDPPLTYAIPRTNDCVFGGTNELSADPDPDPATTSGSASACVLFGVSGFVCAPINCATAVVSFITTATAAPALPSPGVVLTPSWPSRQRSVKARKSVAEEAILLSS